MLQYHLAYVRLGSATLIWYLTYRGWWVVVPFLSLWWQLCMSKWVLSSRITGVGLIGFECIMMTSYQRKGENLLGYHRLLLTQKIWIRSPCAQYMTAAFWINPIWRVQFCFFLVGWPPWLSNWFLSVPDVVAGSYSTSASVAPWHLTLVNPAGSRLTWKQGEKGQLLEWHCILCPKNSFREGKVKDQTMTALVWFYSCSYFFTQVFLLFLSHSHLGGVKHTSWREEECVSC